MGKAKPFAAGMAVGLVWGLAVFFITLLALVFSGYGDAFTELLISLYPGYRVSVIGAIIGMFYGFVDAFIGGWIVVWLYNRF
ncbi:MAG: bacteriophage holin [Nanoarchaeota archaeon]|nr:bacteriophage holin [Nanoarchaeota archaeon]